MKNLSNVLTEKGNLKAQVARDLRAQCGAHLESLGFVRMPNGKYAMVVADADGKTVTMNLELSVGLDTDFSAKEKSSKAKVVKVEQVEVPSLF